MFDADGTNGRAGAVPRDPRADLAAHWPLTTPDPGLRGGRLLVGVGLGRIDRGGQVRAGHAARFLAFRPVATHEYHRVSSCVIPNRDEGWEGRPGSR